MTDLRRTPSLQHAVAMIRETVEETIFEFEKLERANIRITLDPSRRLFKPMMEGMNADWAKRQIMLEKRPANIPPNVSLVEAFSIYAAGRTVPWFRASEKHFYPIGAGIIIPVQPNGFWLENKKLHVLWPQCWKGRTLDLRQKAILNTILRDTYFVGDFKAANLAWVDMREIAPRCGRTVEVLSADQLGTVTRKELVAYMGILVAAFQKYYEMKIVRKAAEKRSRRPAPGSTPLFTTNYPTIQNNKRQCLFVRVSESFLYGTLDSIYFKHLPLPPKHNFRRPL